MLGGNCFGRVIVCLKMKNLNKKYHYEKMCCSCELAGIRFRRNVFKWVLLVSIENFLYICPLWAVNHMTIGDDRVII